MRVNMRCKSERGWIVWQTREVQCVWVLGTGILSGVMLRQEVATVVGQSGTRVPSHNKLHDSGLRRSFLYSGVEEVRKIYKIVPKNDSFEATFATSIGTVDERRRNDSMIGDQQGHAALAGLVRRRTCSWRSKF